MAAQETRKSVTDLMAELTAVRRFQYRSFDIEDGYTISLTSFAFDTDDCLQAVYHDVRQPLVHYTLPWPDFERLVHAAPLLEQIENN